MKSSQIRNNKIKSKIRSISAIINKSNNVGGLNPKNGMNVQNYINDSFD